jgi:hypothetical protein
MCTGESDTTSGTKVVQVSLLSLEFSDGWSSSLLKLIQSFLHNQVVHTGMQIDTGFFGRIELVYTEPRENSIITTDTEFSFHKGHDSPAAIFMEKMLSQNEESNYTAKLKDLLTDRLPGVESSLCSICDQMMRKISRVVKCDEPSAVSAGLLIQGYGGSGKTTILHTFETFFQNQDVSVTYLNCSLLLSESKR